MKVTKIKCLIFTKLSVMATKLNPSNVCFVLGQLLGSIGSMVRGLALALTWP
jgi:hypothetical protein